MKLLISLILLCLSANVQSWGFYAHKKINQTAIYSLPPEMIGFYKKNISGITERAISPDQRRYIDPNEAVRHYIDLDVYGDSAWTQLPKYWSEAVEKYGEDSLRKYGELPWHVYRVQQWLSNAFTNSDGPQILRLSADIGHYIADAHVPLHTTENYNGQLTNQLGIHGFWESRLPELFAEDYDLFVGRASYLDDPQAEIWRVIKESHLALDSVFAFEKELTHRIGESRKYVIEQRGRTNVRTYSVDFSEAYHRALSGMVERRMRQSIRLIADFWYTAWVDGGQPNLDELLEDQGEDEVQTASPDSKLRNHESGEIIDGNP